jgi:hypothetical protein
MKSTRHLLSFFVVVMACSGCIPVPYHTIVRPGIGGLLADAHTGQPIEGASITLSSTNFFQQMPTRFELVDVSTKSTPDGAFSIPPQQGWRWVPYPNWAPNDSTVECHLLVDHNGYETYRLSFVLPDSSLGWPMPATKNLPKVYLQPLHQ